MDFKGKIVWITGASSGIGRALALAFAREGAVVIASARSEEKLRAVRSSSCTPANVHVRPMDMGSVDSIRDGAAEVLGRFGHVDILVNNAGISQRSTALDTPSEIDRRIMEVDYFGAVMLTKLILPGMIANGGGHLLCTSSIVGVFGFPLRSAYSAAKHALHGFFESVRAEYHDAGIRVSVIIGGRIRTDISLNALNPDGTPYGKMDRGQQNGITAEKAARKILKGVKRNKPEIRVGGMELLMVTLWHWFPRMNYRLARRVKST